MMWPRKDENPELRATKLEAVRLRQEERKSCTQIGEQLGVSAHTVANWLAQAGITTQTRCRSPQPITHRHRDLSRDELLELYLKTSIGRPDARRLLKQALAATTLTPSRNAQPGQLVSEEE